jgi:hypothetical protein
MKRRTPDPPDPTTDDGSMELSLEDTLAQRMRGVPVKARTTGGYNPYDAVPLGKAKEQGQDKRKQRTDLRKLSEWIRLTKEINELKKQQS